MSVCIVNRDYGRFVGDAVASALAQTHPYVEVVVVDDGSSDDSLRQLRRFGDRITLVEQGHRGMGAALNAAFARARGQLVMFLDSDDTIHADAVAVAVRAFQDDPALVKVQLRMEVVDADMRHVGLLPSQEGLLPDGDLLRHVLRFRSYPWLGSSAVFSSAALRRVLPLDAGEFRVQKDYYLHQLMPLIGPTRTVERPLYRYRDHGRNTHLGNPVSAAWLQDSLRRTVAIQSRMHELACELGIRGCPRDAREPLDASFAAFRIASLALDPANHPIPGDHRLSVALHGLHATIRHPYLGRVRGRVVRGAWFLVVGASPRRLAASIVRRWVPDAPSARRRALGGGRHRGRR